MSMSNSGNAGPHVYERAMKGGALLNSKIAMSHDGGAC
jgi:hypothetical protein